MRARFGPILLAVAVSLALAGGVLSDFLPTTCWDECADESDRCADCRCCAPARATVILEQPESGFVQTSSAHETLDFIRPSRSEERDVFHVPRHSA